MGVDGESGGDFFRQIFSNSDRWRVRGHTSPLAVARFLFDPNVGNWKLSSNHLKPMSFGNKMFLPGRSPARTMLREITVEALLHLIVENDAEISASLALDLLCGLLMEPVAIGVVASRGPVNPW